MPKFNQTRVGQRSNRNPVDKDALIASGEPFTIVDCRKQILDPAMGVALFFDIDLQLSGDRLSLLMGESEDRNDIYNYFHDPNDPNPEPITDVVLTQVTTKAGREAMIFTAYEEGVSSGTTYKQELKTEDQIPF